MRSFVLIAAALASAVLVAAPAAAQPAPGARSSTQTAATRAELTTLLARLDSAARSPAYGAAFRARATAQAEAVRARLLHGDLRAGDQVVVVVEGQQALSDTFLVRPGPVLALPILGEVPLAGLLRSEVEGRVREFVTRYVRDATVHTLPLLQVVVEGGVQRPGYYRVPAETPLSDAVMLAGGPLIGADLRNLRVERGGRVVWEGEELRRAIASGLTLDAMHLEPGDRLYLVARRSNGLLEAARWVVAPLVSGLIYALLR